MKIQSLRLKDRQFLADALENPVPFLQGRGSHKRRKRLYRAWPPFRRDQSWKIGAKLT